MSQSCPRINTVYFEEDWDGEGTDFVVYDPEPDGVIEPKILEDGSVLYIDEPVYFEMKGEIVYGVPAWDFWFQK